MGKRTNTAAWLEKYHRWQIQVMKDGERKTFTCATPGKAGQRECNAKADAWLDDDVVSGSVRVSTLFEEFLEKVKQNTSTSNYNQHKYFWDRWIEPEIGNLKIEKLNEGKLQDILDHAYAGKKKDGSRISKKTLTGIRGAISGFLKFCRKRKATRLIAEDLEIPRGAVTREKHILQPDDLRKLFACTLTTWWGTIVEDELINAYRLQAITGLRPGELLGLEWRDIVDGNLYVRRSINKNGEVTTGKNENAKRVIALTDQAKTLLADQRHRNPFGRIFGEIDQAYYYKRWKAFREHNGLTSVSPYELRHTFVSIAKTLPEGEIRAVVGHSRNMDTFGTYGHELTGERQQTAEKIGSIIQKILSD